MDNLSFAGMASFVYIFLKAFQQLNVVNGRFIYVIPTSLAMATAELTIIASVVIAGFSWPLVLVIGLGGGTGCIVAMLINKRMTND